MCFARSAHLCEAEAVASDFLQESLEVRASRLLLLGAIRMHHDQCLLQVRKEAEQKEADILLRHKVMTNKVGTDCGSHPASYRVSWCTESALLLEDSSDFLSAFHFFELQD